jgi:hypothetical protein
MEGSGATIEVLYPGYRRPLITAPKHLDMTILPPGANDWGVTHPIPGRVRPLLVEGEGQLAEKI